MRARSVLIGLMFSLLLASASGCGSGGASNTTGTLVLATVTPATASMKSAVTATAAFSSPLGTGQGLDVTFSTDHPELYYNGTAKVNSGGTATYNFIRKPLTAATAPTGPVTVTVYASTGDIQVPNPKTFVLEPAIMALTPPASATFSVSGIAVGSVFRLIPSGMFVTLTDGLGNPVPQGTSVTISVKNIVNGSVGDVLFWQDYPNGTLSAPPSSLTQKTDAFGQVPLNVTIDIVVPSSKTQSEVVNWQVTFIDPDTGATINGYAFTSFSITP